MPGRSEFDLMNPGTLEVLSHIFKVSANLQICFYIRVVGMCFLQNLLQFAYHMLIYAQK